MQTQTKAAIAVAIVIPAMLIGFIAFQTDRATELSCEGEEIGRRIDATRANIEAFQADRPHMLNCRVCDKAISSTAVVCPNCGDLRK